MRIYVDVNSFRPSISRAEAIQFGMASNSVVLVHCVTATPTPGVWILGCQLAI